MNLIKPEFSFEAVQLEEETEAIVPSQEVADASHAVFDANVFEYLQHHGYCFSNVKSRRKDSQIDLLAFAV